MNRANVGHYLVLRQTLLLGCSHMKASEAGGHEIGRFVQGSAPNRHRVWMLEEKDWSSNTERVEFTALEMGSVGSNRSVWVKVLRAAATEVSKGKGERPLGLDCNSTALYHTVFFHDLRC